MNKWFWIELKQELQYWLTGRQAYGYPLYHTVEDRFDEFKQILWRLYRKTLCCPLGKHYVKWNSGDPKCIICWRRYNEIFK